TATFHWVPDHDVLFAHVAAALRPGGALAAQCGGAGNLVTVVRALEDLGADPFTGKVFATPERTSERLRKAGFDEVECWLHPEPTVFASLEDLGTFLRTVVLREHVSRMTDAEAGAFVYAVATRLPRLELDYVRLDIAARRG
ncbi:MAG: class I SAM-dependent methyltransferase, partial [Actinomycetota bacterium]